MGSGKSHWGKKLADLLNWNFIDLDKFIEEKESITIPGIFAQQGESHFRSLEKKYLEETTKADKTVIASGGGTPCFYDNMEVMNRTGETVYLKAQIKTIVERLSKKANTRPLLKGKSETELPAFFEEQLKKREPFYLQAKYIIEVEKLSDRNFVEIFSSVTTGKQHRPSR